MLALLLSFLPLIYCHVALVQAVLTADAFLMGGLQHVAKG